MAQLRFGGVPFEADLVAFDCSNAHPESNIAIRLVNFSILENDVVANRMLEIQIGKIASPG